MINEILGSVVGGVGTSLGKVKSWWWQTEGDKANPVPILPLDNRPSGNVEAFCGNLKFSFLNCICNYTVFLLPQSSFFSRFQPKMFLLYPLWELFIWRNHHEQ